jgi:hypothetical protein
MTSQQKSNVDGRDERAGAAAARQQNSDTLAKSYRYLRLAMVGLLLCLTVAVLYQSWRQGWNFLGSISAYYYTPAQAFFVGGLIGLGACMIALKGTTPVEDVFLNLGGVFAAIVAIVPTGRDADYRAAVRACREVGTPLLTQKASTGRLDCPTVQALEDATKANVDNNLAVLLAVGAVALVTSVVVAWKDGTLNRQADRDAARRSPGVAVRQSLKAVGEFTAFGRRDWYNWARVTLLVAAVTFVLWVAGLITLFWVEAAVFLFFMAFWTAQTFELERSTRPAGMRRRPPPTKKNFWWGFGVALGLWLAVLIARLASLQWVIDNAHYIAAVFLFVCVLVVVWQNSRRVERERSGDVRSPA